jgi:hypothetical protein
MKNIIKSLILVASINIVASDQKNVVLPNQNKASNPSIDRVKNSGQIVTNINRMPKIPTSITPTAHKAKKKVQVSPVSFLPNNKPQQVKNPNQ